MKKWWVIALLAGFGVCMASGCRAEVDDDGASINVDD